MLPCLHHFANMLNPWTVGPSITTATMGTIHTTSPDFPLNILCQVMSIYERKADDLQSRYVELYRADMKSAAFDCCRLLGIMDAASNRVRNERMSPACLPRGVTTLDVRDL